MYMVGHDTPCKKFQSFLFLAIREVINQNVFVFIAGKNINPTLNGQSYIIKIIRIMELIFSAHSRNIAVKQM